jgi:hypothetical protein
MAAHEIRRRHAVAVDEYHVIGGGCRQRAVARGAGPETEVFLPDVAQREIRALCIVFNQLPVSSVEPSSATSTSKPRLSGAGNSMQGVRPV